MTFESNLSSEHRPVPILSAQSLVSCAVLLLLVWFGSFCEFRRFTLYADDWLYLGRVLSDRPSFHIWWTSIIPWADGRPIQTGLYALTGALMHDTAGVAAPYLLLFGLTALSVIAIWWMLTHRFSNEVALVAAAIFAISPLVSIRPFLNGIASPVAFLLLALAGVLYLSRWRLVSYLVAALILPTYEMVFPLFVLLPAVLRPLRIRRDLSRLLLHAVICAALLAAQALFREKYGNNRLSDMTAGHGFGELALGIVNAALVSLQGGLVGSVDVGLWLDRIPANTWMLVWGGLAFAGFVLLLWRLSVRPDDAPRAGWPVTTQTVAVLLAMTLSGYALTYFGESGGVDAVLGRISRFHSAAALPIAILSGMALVGLLRVARPIWLRAPVAAAGAGYLAVLFAFSLTHQEDFAAEAERQRLMVRQLAADHPEMGPLDTFILKAPSLPWPDQLAIEFNDTHSFYRLLGDLYDFSDGTGAEIGPTIRVVSDDAWPRLLSLGPDGRLDWTGSIWSPVPDHVGHVWYYDWTLDGRLIPRETPILVEGRNILHERGDPEAASMPLAERKRLPLFTMLMGPQATVLDRAALTAPAP